MKITYDKTVDAIYIYLKPDKVARTVEENDGLIFDYSADGNIIGIEILDASKKITEPDKVEFQLSGQ